jgi:hypothetical protein
MVIGERFVWAHLPKAAGSATDRMFRLFPDLVEFADVQDTNDKHTPFAQRREMIGDRLLAMNIRRLPAWVLSRAQYVARHGIYPDYEPIPIGTPQELAESGFPDSRIEIYTDGGKLEIDRWIRTEHLTDDFLRFVSEFTAVSEEQARGVAAIGPVNAEEYDHRVETWFTPEQIRLMYERNPLWARLEAQIYGALYEPRG